MHWPQDRMDSLQPARDNDLSDCAMFGLSHADAEAILGEIRDTVASKWHAACVAEGLSA